MRSTLIESSRYLLPNVLVLAAACNVTIPEGKLKCDSKADCPSDWMCIDKLCYSEPPGGASGMDGGPGGDASTGSDGGGGGKDATVGGDTDAGSDAGGIDTTSCDAPMPFYHDSDGDGLGDMSLSISACSVSSGYVTNKDDCDDTCKACTKPSATETCDGFDNNCSGKVDEGAQEVSAPTAFEGMEDGDWAELVATADGGVLFTIIRATPSILAQRFDLDGKRVGDLVTLDGAAPGTPVLAADHLNGKIVLGYQESDGIKAMVLKASDLSVSVAEKTISAAVPTTMIIDVAVSTSASGGRAMFAYDADGKLRVQGFKLSTLAVDTAAHDVYTLAGGNLSLGTTGTLVGAPCLSGFYLAVTDLNTDELSVFPLDGDGLISGTKYTPTIPADQSYSGQAALRVEGGDCASAPTRLVLAYSSANASVDATTTRLALELLDIVPQPGETYGFNKSGGASIEPTGWVWPAVSVVGNGFYANRGIDVIRVEQRYLFGAMALSMKNKGSFEVYEVDGADVIGQHSVPGTPVLPLNVQFARVGGRVFMGAASWTDDGAAGVMRIGCGS